MWSLAILLACQAAPDDETHMRINTASLSEKAAVAVDATGKTTEAAEQAAGSAVGEHPNDKLARILRENAQYSKQAADLYNAEKAQEVAGLQQTQTYFDQSSSQAAATVNGQERDVSTLINEVHQLKETAQFQMESHVSSTAAKIDPVAKAEKVQVNNANKALSAVDSRYEKEMDALMKGFERLMDQLEKAQDSAIGGAEKKLEKEQKEGTKAQKKAEKDIENKMEKEQSVVEKTNDKNEKAMDDQNEVLNEESGQTMEASGEFEQVADQVTAGTEGAEGFLEQALENKDTKEEDSEEAMVNAFDKVGSVAATNAADTEVELAGQNKAAMESIEEAAEGADERNVELAKGQERALKASAATLKGEESNLDSQMSAEQKQQSKLETEVDKNTDMVSSNSEKQKEAIANLKEVLKGLVQAMQEQSTSQASDKTQELEKDVEKMETGAEGQVTRQADQIKSESAGATETVAATFASNLAQIAAKLAAAQRAFQETSAKISNDQLLTDKNQGILDSLQTSVPKLMNIAEQSEKQNKNVMDGAGDDATRILDQLDTTTQKAFEQIAADLAKAIKSTGDTSTELNGEMDKSETTAMDQLKKTADNAAGAISKIEQETGPISKQERVAAAQLGAAQTEIKETQEASRQATAKVLQKLQELFAQIQTNSVSLGDLNKKSSDESAAFQENAVTSVQEALTNLITKTASAQASNQKEVTDLLGETQKLEAARRMAEDNAAQVVNGKITQDAAKLDAQQKKTQPMFEEFMKKIAAAMSKVSDMSQGLESQKDGFDQEVQKSLIDKIAALSSQTDELLGKNIKKAESSAEDLREEVEDAQKQAASEAQQTHNQVQDSIDAVKKEYENIFAKVKDTEKKSQEDEGGESGGYTARVDKSISALRAELAAQQQKLAAVQKTQAEAESTSNVLVGDFASTQNKARTSMTNQLMADISQIKEEAGQQTSDLYKKMSAEERKVRQLSSTTMSDQAMLQQKFQEATAAVESDEDRAADAVKGMRNDASAKERTEMQELETMSLSQQRKLTQEKSELAQQRRDLNQEDAAVKTEVKTMENGVKGLLQNLSPERDLKIVGKSIGEIDALMDKAQNEEQKKVQEVEQDVKNTQNRIEKIIAEAGVEGGALSKEVMQTALQVRNKFSSLRTEISGEQNELRTLAKETSSVADDLASAQHNRVNAVGTKVQALRDQLEKALGLSKYQGADSVDKANHMFDRIEEVQKGLVAEKDVLSGTTEKFRTQVQNVLEELNMALNLEEIENTAMANMANDDGNSAMSAKEAMDREIAKIQAAMQNEMSFCRKVANEKIQEIMAQKGVHQSVKDRQIAAIKSKMQQELAALTMKTKSLMSKQYQSAHDMDSEIADLQALLDRAQSVANAHPDEQKKWVSQMMAGLTKQLASLRTRFVDNYSLLETHEQAIPASPRAAAFLQASDELAAMSAERQNEDEAWTNALNVLQEALPAVTAARAPH